MRVVFSSPWTCSVRASEETPGPSRECGRDQVSERLGLEVGVHGVPTSSFWTYSSSYDGDGQAAATLQYVHSLWGQVDSQLRSLTAQSSRGF